MMRKILCIFIVTACGVAHADCLDQQREVNRLKNNAMKEPGALARFSMGGCTTKEVRAYMTALIAFERKCYAERGWTRLQAENDADEGETMLANSEGSCE
jgi:hypothetical protein